MNHLYVCSICQVEIETLAKRRRLEIDTFIKLNKAFQAEESPSVLFCISMQWFREWEAFVKGKDSGESGRGLGALPGGTAGGCPVCWACPRRRPRRRRLGSGPVPRRGARDLCLSGRCLAPPGQVSARLGQALLQQRPRASFSALALLSSWPLLPGPLPWALCCPE